REHLRALAVDDDLLLDDRQGELHHLRPAFGDLVVVVDERRALEGDLLPGQGGEVGRLVEGGVPQLEGVDRVGRRRRGGADRQGKGGSKEAGVQEFHEGVLGYPRRWGRGYRRGPPAPLPLIEVNRNRADRARMRPA